MGKVAIVTGSCGLAGNAVTRYLLPLSGMEVVGIDNDFRGKTFGKGGSTSLSRKQLIEEYGKTLYIHEDVDIRNQDAIQAIFHSAGKEVELVVHAAGQPSHDWSALHPMADFDINARATLLLLEATRGWCPNASFVYLSTNKVYGDKINDAQFDELPTRWEWPGHMGQVRWPGIPASWHGVREAMSLDRTLHSPFGVSKLYGDLAVQEYGRYFGMNTVCFRCGCITGGGHRGVPLHGFLAYLGKCVREGLKYTVIGYKGKQVRDNIHAEDLAQAIWIWQQDPRPGAVYNMGGGRENSCSILEAIESMTRLAGKSLNWDYNPQHRKGDHVWWITDTTAFGQDYPRWSRIWDLQAIYESILGGEK